VKIALKNGTFWPIMVLTGIAAVLAGCGGSTPSAPPAKSQLHKDVPPHGGTPVALGEDYRLELVLDAPAGKLDAYVFDGEFENFVRINAESFQVTAHLPGGGQILAFKAVPNAATGETVGDTSMFETQADWLKTQKSFDAVLQQLTVKGATYTNVAFNFPNGTAADEIKN
jgi:hypothetical protein